MTQQIILNHQQIQHIIKRIAFQIYETFVNEETIILAGIKENGYILATKIKTELENISDLKIMLCSIQINKKLPTAPVVASIDATLYKNQSIVLIDDVLNTGSTLIYAVKHLLENEIKKCKTAVLVNRNHKNFPIKADFKGISLSTSKNEDVQVVFEASGDLAFLE